MYALKRSVYVCVVGVLTKIYALVIFFFCDRFVIMQSY